MRVSEFIAMAIVGAVTGFAGCASTSSARSQPTTSTAAASTHEHGKDDEHGKDTMEGMCPMQVPGTTVTLADVEGGVALNFTTSTGDIAELRQRVRRLAEMHNRQPGSGMMMGHGTSMENRTSMGQGMPMGHGTPMARGMTVSAATTSVEDIAGGARLVRKPIEPSQLEALRQQAQRNAQMMAGGECPMMAPRGDHSTK